MGLLDLLCPLSAEEKNELAIRRVDNLLDKKFQEGREYERSTMRFQIEQNFYKVLNQELMKAVNSVEMMGDLEEDNQAIYLNLTIMDRRYKRLIHLKPDVITWFVEPTTPSGTGVEQDGLP